LEYSSLLFPVCQSDTRFSVALKKEEHSFQTHCCVFLITRADLFAQQQSRQSQLVWHNLEGCCNNRQNKKHKEEPGSCLKTPSELWSLQKYTGLSNQHDQPVSRNPAASAGRKTCQGQTGGSQKK